MVFLGPRVALLVVVLSPSQSFILCVAQHIELLCSFLTCLRLNLSSFVLPNTSSRSARCRLVSVSIFAALVCSSPRVDLLVVDLFRQSRQSVSTFRALCGNLDSLCLLFSCLWRLFKYSYFHRTGSCKLTFHSPKLLSIRHLYIYKSTRCEIGFACISRNKALNAGRD